MIICENSEQDTMGSIKEISVSKKWVIPIQATLKVLYHRASHLP